MITLQAIGTVNNKRKTPEDDHWAAVESSITLSEAFTADALIGLDTFSHVAVIFHFHLLSDDQYKEIARPRGNANWPEVGIFAQRKKRRPNKLGYTIAEIVRVEGKTILLKNLDAIDGSPVLDIKPIMKEFLPQSQINQPNWASELMENYW